LSGREVGFDRDLLVNPEDFACRIDEGGGIMCDTFFFVAFGESVGSSTLAPCSPRPNESSSLSGSTSTVLSDGRVFGLISSALVIAKAPPSPASKRSPSRRSLIQAKPSCTIPSPGTCKACRMVKEKMMRIGRLIAIGPKIVMSGCVWYFLCNAKSRIASYNR